MPMGPSRRAGPPSLSSHHHRVGVVSARSSSFPDGILFVQKWSGRSPLGMGCPNAPHHHRVYGDISGGGPCWSCHGSSCFYGQPPQAVTSMQRQDCGAASCYIQEVQKEKSQRRSRRSSVPSSKQVTNMLANSSGSWLFPRSSGVVARGRVGGSRHCCCLLARLRASRLFRSFCAWLVRGSDCDVSCDSLLRTTADTLLPTTTDTHHEQFAARDKQEGGGISANVLIYQYDARQFLLSAALVPCLGRAAGANGPPRSARCPRRPLTLPMPARRKVTCLLPSQTSA